MKYRTIAAVLALAAFATVDVASAASFGRSGSSSYSSPSRSYSSPSYSAPSRPSYSAPSYSAPKPSAPAPSYSAPTQSSAIGGTAGSMGVRKAEVTAPVAAKVDTQRATAASNTAARSLTSAPAPSYSSPAAAPSPSYAAPAAAASSGPGFGTIFGGTVAGVIAGNAITSMLGGGNHGGGGGSAPAAAAPMAAGAPAVAPAVDAAGNPIAYAPAQAVAQQSSYGIGSFIWDVISFAFLIAILALIAFLGYKGFKMARDYINRERGVAPTQPFAPTAKFWEIQKAFAAADIATLKTLLGPDLVEEATNGLVPCEVTLSHVSHETVLSNPREVSVHYTFFDEVVDETVDQVWHYELHGGTWKLNGIETV